MDWRASTPARRRACETTGSRRPTFPTRRSCDRAGARSSISVGAAADRRTAIGTKTWCAPPTWSITKPGYGIISESIANDTAILYTSRGRFVEYDVLVREMPRYLRAQFIEQRDLLRGNWSGALEALLQQPAPPEKPALNGADVAAEEILRFGRCSVLFLLPSSLSASEPHVMHPGRRHVRPDPFAREFPFAEHALDRRRPRPSVAPAPGLRSRTSSRVGAGCTERTRERRPA